MLLILLIKPIILFSEDGNPGIKSEKSLNEFRDVNFGIIFNYSDSISVDYNPHGGADVVFISLNGKAIGGLKIGKRPPEGSEEDFIASGVSYYKEKFNTPSVVYNSFNNPNGYEWHHIVVNAKYETGEKFIIERFVYIKALKDLNPISSMSGSFSFEFLLNPNDYELVIPEIMKIINSFKIGEKQQENDSENIRIFNELLEKAKKGDLEAQVNLGRIYYKGIGVKMDVIEAFNWFTKAAEQGNARSQYSLGVLYTVGKGVTQNYTEATKWYTKAAEQGFADAQYNLGVMYRNGDGVTLDYTEAFNWFTKAAEKGDEKAQYNLGDMYYQGKGVIQDFILAHMWYNLAYANANDPEIRKDAIDLRNEISKKMTPQQIEEAQRLAKEWTEKRNK